MANNARQEAKILQRIKSSLEEGDYYEAHQRYRALHFRLISQNRVGDALSVLFDGACELFNKQQVDSGTDLSILFLTILNEHKAPITRENISRICTLHGFIRHDHPDRVNFVNGAVKWTSDACKRKHGHSRSAASDQVSDALCNLSSNDLHFVAKYGHPDVHRGFALNLWKERNFPESRQHFLLSNDGESCGKMLTEFHLAVGYSTEIDLFIAQAVFHYLCLKRVTVAKDAFRSYTSQHPEIGSSSPPFKYPLLNFVYFLTLTLEQAKLAVFTVLCEQYATVLKRDPLYFKHLDRIGQIFFGLPPAQGSQRSQPGGGIFGGLLNSIFSAMGPQPEDDEFSEDQEEDEDGEVYENASDALPQQQQSNMRQANNTQTDVD